MSEESSQAELNSLLEQAQAVMVETQREFGQLSAAQLNWKPSPDVWSIGQCFEHLIMTNESFYPDLDELLSGEKRRTFWESLPVLPGLFGKLIISRVRPDSDKKSKAPKVFAPSRSEIDTRIIEKFVTHQNELAGKLRATGKLDLRRVKVTSPIAKFVTYSLLDAFTILVFHERRHLQQAQRVLAASGFPRS